MCVGVPMKIMSVDGLAAHCEADGRSETVDLSLTGPLPVGSWALVFLGAAREALSEADAEMISRALEGLASAMSGEGVGDAFADLEARAPSLPPHLEAARRAGERMA